MPQSSLARLTQLDLEGPWMFQLRNPANPAASTHAGVLEFIAEEGVVHLPYWMMKTLRLNEGDPIRITGAELPKGKLVKLQAQSTHFLEISDPKAVCVCVCLSIVTKLTIPSDLNPHCAISLH
jgi:ubiquitin fusion degradation protein 1